MESVEPLESSGPPPPPSATPLQLEYAGPSSGGRRLSVRTSGGDLVVTFRPSGRNSALHSLLVLFLGAASLLCLFRQRRRAWLRERIDDALVRHGQLRLRLRDGKEFALLPPSNPADQETLGEALAIVHAWLRVRE